MCTHGNRVFWKSVLENCTNGMARHGTAQRLDSRIAWDVLKLQGKKKPGIVFLLWIQHHAIPITFGNR
jgi:hypothetical protein